MLPYEIPDMGRRATVITPGPRVREFPGVPEFVGPPENRSLVLGSGSELLLRDGPVAADGYDWYLAYFQRSIDQTQFGPQSAWVAAGPSGQEPTLMEIGPLRCPVVPMSVALLGSMTDMARRDCLRDSSFEVHAVLEQCYMDGLHPFVEEPGWLGRFCPYLAYELGTSVAVAIHFPPSLLLPSGLSRGDVVRMVGHVNDPAADDCRLVPGPDGDPAYEASPVDQQQTLLTCRAQFVVSEIEVTGHIDLANPFGF
jgi:hypothetical protein